MKRLFLLFLLLPFCAAAQNCNLQKEKDPYTKELKISTGFITLQGTSLSIDADSKEIDFFFTLSGEGKCFDYESMVMVIFEGGKLKTNFRNSGTVNCEGYFHFTFRNGPSASSILTNLSTKKVITLKFTGANKKETTLNLTEEQQKTFMELTACLVKEAKTLLK
jgi:hypothetical protein